MHPLARRVAALELAITSLGRLDFGDVDGHPFHGNQHTGGLGDKAPENYPGRPDVSDKDLLAATNWERQQSGNYQVSHGVSEDKHFGGYVVEHGGLGGSSRVDDRTGNTVSSDIYGGPKVGTITTTKGARWRVEMAGDKPNAERIWRNRDVISSGMVDKLGEKGAFNGSRISVKFHDDGSATVGDYDSHRFEFHVPQTRP